MAPPVTMLWESVNPDERLSERFGFQDGAAVAEWVADVMRRGWNLDITSCDRVVLSSWNVMAWVAAGDRCLIAKWSALPQRFARLRDSARVVAWLDQRGIPVAPLVAATDGSLLREFGNDAKGWARSRLPLPGSRFLLGVLPVISGDLLDINDSKQVADAGRMLAEVHEALAAYPARVGRARPKGEKQLVHNDFRSANLLHDGTGITAVLDLEEITYETRIADLARAAVLLGTRYRGWRPAPEATRELFVASYDAHAKISLTVRECESLPGLIAANLAKPWWSVADGRDE